MEVEHPPGVENEENERVAQEESQAKQTRQVGHISKETAKPMSQLVPEVPKDVQPDHEDTCKIYAASLTGGET